MRGTANPGFKGEDTDYRGPDWPEAREATLARDGHKCRRCGSPEKLLVHHVVYWEISQDNRLENLLTVCRRCHRKVHPTKGARSTKAALQAAAAVR